MQVLDVYFLGLTLLITLAIQSCALAFTFLAQSDALTDLSAAFNFFVLAIGESNADWLPVHAPNVSFNSDIDRGRPL